MRWLAIFWIANAVLHYWLDDGVGKALFWLIGAVLFVLMEIADNTTAGRRNT